MISFEKGERKDDVAKKHLEKFEEEEGILFVGKAQEKARVYRTESRRHPETGVHYPWVVKSTAMVNQYYFYCVDRDFGPFFLKFCSYFPYTAKLYINGHEYVKRQLNKEGIRYEALDNGLRWCEDEKRAKQISESLTDEKIEQLLAKWLDRLPHPFSAEDQEAGYRYQLSILQAEFSLTQVMDRPVSGRILFEEIIHENLDIGSQGQVQLVFNRRITKRTKGRFRTRVITEGVTPSLHVDYKRSRIKQYYKEGRALRTETTINNTRDFGIGKRLRNLPLLREVGFEANRRLLEVERISQDCLIGEEVLQELQTPGETNGQRRSAMRFGDNAVQRLLAAVVLMSLQPKGFRQREMKEQLAQLVGEAPIQITRGQMSYQLRRLRLHGLIKRKPRTHLYEVTDFGLRVALFFTRTYGRLLRPGLTQVIPTVRSHPTKLRAAFDSVTRQIDIFCRDNKLVA